MRGGRNKFGPMYKRDRARKLQMMRQRQIAVQTLQRASPYMIGDGVTLSYNPASTSPYGNLYIKQEIQIPQVSSLTSSPDSSPSPIAVALGQAGLSNAATTPNQPPALQIVAGSNSSSSNNNNNNNNNNNPPSGATSTPGLSLSEHSKLWGNANSTTSSPHSISPKSFQFDSSGSSSSTANKMSPLIRDFVQGLDDSEWQRSLFSLLQNQTYNQCEVDLFELMCKVLDQNLFSQVDWARNSCFFKDLKVSFNFVFKTPIAVALGQAGLSNAATTPNQPPALQIVAGSNSSSSSNNNNNNNNNPPSGATSTPGLSLSEHSKLWGNANSTTSSPHSISPKSFQFDSSGSSSSTANKMSPLIRDFVQGLDDSEWQRSLFSLLQNQTYNQCEVDLFELMCKVLDQNLFSQVDWARNSCFFKDLK
ncbi:nuclear hormone receptor FTZ-F1-like, partial [Diaphorina citri]|uniref:Nuclear hormone receptor FTZ-F1-like n=1 Tax=Diaphorina citri TaxID=121845 RepID=A0A3Q0JGP0_DIACI